jgi:hypothetical protein
MSDWWEVPYRGGGPAKPKGFPRPLASHMKNCTLCGQRKPLDEFHIQAAALDGHRAECKACRRRTRLGPIHLWIDAVVIGPPDECWPWLGARTHGYAKTMIDGKTVRVHRLIARLFGATNGPVHHTCGNKACVNPAHLHRLHDNAEHRRLHRRTTCMRGHALIEYGRHGRRRCHECHAAGERRRKAETRNV